MLSLSRAARLAFPIVEPTSFKVHCLFLECDRHRDRIGVRAGWRSAYGRWNNTIDIDGLGRAIAGAEIAVAGCRTGASGGSGGPGECVCRVNVQVVAKKVGSADHAALAAGGIRTVIHGN